MAQQGSLPSLNLPNPSTAPTVPAAVPGPECPPAPLPTVRRAVVATAPVALPRSTMLLIPVRIRPAMETLFEAPPLIAGKKLGAYLSLVEIAVHEWRPQTFHECSLVKQLVNAEWQIIEHEQMQSWLFNCAIGAEFFAILTAEEGPKPGSELVQKSHPNRSQAIKNVIFAAIAGESEAVEFLEGRTGRKIGIGPETPAQFSPMTPLHIFADRAITTRLARRDSASSKLSLIRAERSGRMADKHLRVADIRSQLNLSQYIQLMIEVDLMKEAEPDLYGQELLQRLNERAAAAAQSEAGAPASMQPGETQTPALSTSEQAVQAVQDLPADNRSVAATKTGATNPVSVHAPLKTTSAPPSPGEQLEGP